MYTACNRTYFLRVTEKEKVTNSKQTENTGNTREDTRNARTRAHDVHGSVSSFGHSLLIYFILGHFCPDAFYGLFAGLKFVDFYCSINRSILQMFKSLCVEFYMWVSNYYTKVIAMKESTKSRLHDGLSPGSESVFSVCDFIWNC